MSSVSNQQATAVHIGMSRECKLIVLYRNNRRNFDMRRFHLKVFHRQKHSANFTKFAAITLLPPFSKTRHMPVVHKPISCTNRATVLTISRRTTDAQTDGQTNEAQCTVQFLKGAPHIKCKLVP